MLKTGSPIFEQILIFVWIQYMTTWQYNLQYNTIQYNIIQYNTIQNKTIQKALTAPFPKGSEHLQFEKYTTYILHTY